MLYLCKQCHNSTFETWCSYCDDNNIIKNKTPLSDHLVPLDPSFYPEFQYRSKGLIKDLFGKKKEKAYLSNLLDHVLEKYQALKSPYFINFIHTTRSPIDDIQSSIFYGARTDGIYSDYEVFHEVLVRKGFDELRDYPELLEKLIFTTHFSNKVSSFSSEVSRHIKNDLDSSLRSWIEESGTIFREDMPLFLYYLWKEKINFNGIDYNNNSKFQMGNPLVTLAHLKKIKFHCEQIYFDITVNRLQARLEHFDTNSFVSMYHIDAMDGFEFEDFLAEMFALTGANIKKTKRTGDQGADLFIENFGKSIVIQAKNYTHNVGNSAVQQAYAACQFYGCDEAMVITNSFFTPSAKALSSATGVKLIDREGLQGHLDDYNQAMINGAD